MDTPLFVPLTPLPGFEAAEEWAVIFACAFMLFDIIVGSVCALSTGTFTSSKAREGLCHKALILMVIVLAVFVQLASGVIGDLGFDIPTIVPVCTVVIVMEVASCIENIGQANPDLKDCGIFKFFNRKDDEE